MNRSESAEKDQTEYAALSSRFGGAIIDPHGNEIPITEEMIREACQSLEKQAIIGLHARTLEC